MIVAAVVVTAAVAAVPVVVASVVTVVALAAAVLVAAAVVAVVAAATVAAVAVVAAAVAVVTADNKVHHCFAIFYHGIRRTGRAHILRSSCSQHNQSYHYTTAGSNHLNNRLKLKTQPINTCKHQYIIHMQIQKGFNTYKMCAASREL